VAKTSVNEFVRQVQAETKKVAWPTGRETWMTALMVVIMATVLSIFFFGVDRIFQTILTMLLRLIG
jgi:preprotein translocase subunit SecE